LKGYSLATLTTPNTTKFAVPFFTRILDKFRNQERITVEWTSPNNENVYLLWALFEWKSGERRIFIIEGHPGFCSAALKELYRAGGNIDQLIKLNRLD
jgi:hypothetical protein